MKVRAVFLAVLVTIAASGCCAFGPCDRVSMLAGRVSSVEGTPVVGAKITAQGHNVNTDGSGCFTVGGIEVGPGTLTIFAPGFEPLIVSAKSGTYQVTAVVAPQGSSQVGIVRWSKSRNGRPEGAPGCT
jgi:hypothetical protein